MSGCDEEEPGRAHASQDRRSKNHHILIPDARLSCGRAWKMQRRVGRGSGESCGVSMSVGAADSERCYDGGFAGCRAGLDVQSALLCLCVCVVCASGRACLALQAASECRQKLQREKLEDLEEALRLYLVRKGRGSCCILGRLRACDRRPLLSS